MTTTDMTDLINRATSELNDAAGAVNHVVLSDDISDEEARRMANDALDEIQRLIHLDPSAIYRAARENATTVTETYEPREVLADPIGVFAAVWQAGFLVGARTQQLTREG